MNAGAHAGVVGTKHTRGGFVLDTTYASLEPYSKQVLINWQ